MCGRYSIAVEEENIEFRQIIEQINQEFGNTIEHAAMKTGEIFPTDIVPILTAQNNDRRAVLMKWGFPRFDSSGVIINARAETANEKPMFRTGVAKRRCLVPATGFFEWKHEGEKKKKDKFLLRLKDTSMLYFAGIYNTFHNKDEQPYTGFVILTTAANPSVQPIHNRMPLILTGNKKDMWLFDDALSPLLLREECDAELERIAQ